VIKQSNELGLAPIALFTFKRPDHTRRTLESMAENPEFLDSPLFIYCDGARNNDEASQVEETRRVVRDWFHPNKTLIERDKNWGLANSVIAGVTDLCERFGRVIVVEDDLVVSPVFLKYLNSALDHYIDEEKVMQISGYMFPVESIDLHTAVMLPITSTWGWATWARAWDKFDPSLTEVDLLFADRKVKQAFNLDNSYPYTRRLKQQIKGESDSWGIRWYWSVFRVNGLVVYPPVSLVQNIGHDGTGIHCTVESDHETLVAETFEVTFPRRVSLTCDAFIQVKALLRKQNRPVLRLWARIRTKYNRIIKIKW